MKKLMILSLLAAILFVACNEDAPVSSKPLVVLDEDTIYTTVYDTALVPETLWLTEYDTIYDTIVELADTVPHGPDASTMAQVYVARAIRDYAEENELDPNPHTWFMPYSDAIDRTTHWEVTGHLYSDVFGPYNQWQFYCKIRYTGGEVDRSYNWVADTIRWDM